MKAEEFLLEYRIKNKLSMIYNRHSLGSEIAKLMEAYHKAKVENIEDKKTKWQTNGMLADTWNEGFVNGWNACKNELLKQ